MKITDLPIDVLGMIVEEATGGRLEELTRVAMVCRLFDQVVKEGYVKKIDTTHKSFMFRGKAILRYLKSFSNIRELKVTTSIIHALLCNDSSYLTTLEKLVLTNEYYNMFNSEPKACAHLARLHNLKEISLCQVKINEEHLAELGEISTLEKIDISGSCVKGVFAKWGKLQSLHTLILTHSPTVLHEEDIQHLCTLTSLKILNLRGTWITCNTHTCLTHFQKLIHIQELNLSGCLEKKDVHHVEELGGVLSLQTVKLCGIPLTGKEFAFWGKLTKLKQIDLDGCSLLSEKGFEQIGRLTTLTHLSLARANIPRGSLRLLTNLSSLKVLDVTDSYVPCEDGESWLQSVIFLKKNIFGLDIVNRSQIPMHGHSSMFIPVFDKISFYKPESTQK